MTAYANLVAAAACALAFAGGSIGLSGAIADRARENRRRHASGAAVPRDGARGEGAARRVAAYACRLERRLSRDAARSGSTGDARSGRLGERVESLATAAGLSGQLGPAGYREARVRIGLALAAAGALAGSVFSTELAVLLACAGVGAGLASVRWSLRTLKAERLAALERDLPEMLEVVALGLRSGLAFDRSFALYHTHFDTAFACECASAQRRWSLGLASREEALRELASCYDSPLLRRSVDAAVRSLRFGTSLAEAFESQAGEARAVRKARREEQVAKAPVKMMVPTGALILPAMLLLVLGPVLLELMEGF